MWVYEEAVGSKEKKKVDNQISLVEDRFSLIAQADERLSLT